MLCASDRQLRMFLVDDWKKKSPVHLVNIFLLTEMLKYLLHEAQHIIKIISLCWWKLTQFGLILHIVVVLKHIAEIKLLLITLETHAHRGNNVQKLQSKKSLLSSLRVLLVLLRCCTDNNLLPTPPGVTHLCALGLTDFPCFCNLLFLSQCGLQSLCDRCPLLRRTWLLLTPTHCTGL